MLFNWRSVSPAVIYKPEGNGVVKRFVRTLKNEAREVARGGSGSIIRVVKCLMDD